MGNFALWVKQNLAARCCGDNGLAKNEGRAWKGLTFRYLRANGLAKA
jgi:hypothetical protein